MTGSRVIALGHYLPEKVLTNADLATIVDTSDEWIQSRVGVRERRVAGDEDTIDMMAAAAADKALAKSGLAPEEIDFVIVATCTAFDRSPNIAARVARRLGITAPAAMDVNTACSGFTHALATADLAIKGNSASKALVIGVERMTDITDWADRTTCVLVGDGAGAAVVVASDQPTVSPVVWGSVPEMGEAVVIENDTFSQIGLTVYRWATTVLPEVAKKVCETAGVRPEDLDAVVLHQANLRIVEPLAQRLGAVNAVVARDVVESGNTSAASIPIALSKLIERGEVPPGALTLLLGFGGGLTYAGQVIRCPE